jgi:two-component sensor histidine kinase
VQILALGLHELATNARKHGALASRDGQLSVTWTVDDNGGARRVLLKWEETGIVARGASDAERVGLGRTLIEESLPFQLDAETRLVIGSDTVRFSVALALE